MDQDGGDVKLTKIEIARRQLGGALALYLEGADPVSVHCLVCGGCEIAEQLAIDAGEPPFRNFALDAHPEMSGRSFKAVRNRFWNAMKHSTTRAGVPRDDAQLLAEFDHIANEERLFVGWFDYGMAATAQPIEVQVYTLWILARQPETLAPDADSFRAEMDSIFPKLSGKHPAAQLRDLKKTIAKSRRDSRLMNDPRTERRPLMIPA